METQCCREILPPGHFADDLPELLESLPPPELSNQLQLVEEQHNLQSPSIMLQTRPNAYGLFRKYYRTNSLPSHDPDSELTMQDHCDIPSSGSGAENPEELENISHHYGPYPNRSSFLLGEWNWNDQVQKSKSSFKSLVDVITDPDFRPDDIRETQWDVIDRELGDSNDIGADLEDDPMDWLQNDARWTKTPIIISVPFHRYHKNPGPRDYVVSELYHRSIVSILQEALSHPLEGLQFHFEPYELYWQRNNQADPVRVFGELYTSPAFIDAYRALQGSPPEAGCNLPRAVVGLMLASDATHVTSFGNTKIWPLYLYFGNHSKYRRCKPTCRLCYHVAYFQKVSSFFVLLAESSFG